MEDVSRWNLGYVTCIECGKMFREISAAHLRSHGMTRAEYRDKYGIPKGVKLNHCNLAGRWQQDVRPPYECEAKLYYYCSSRITQRSWVRVRFNLDYVSGIECWVGVIDELDGKVSDGKRLRSHIPDSHSYYAIKLDTGERHMVKIIGVNHLDKSHNFESAWPEIIHDTKIIKNIFRLDPRVKEIKRRRGDVIVDDFIDTDKKFSDCVNDKEELYHLTWREFDQDINLRRYAFAKTMVNSLDKMSAVMVVKAYHELSYLVDKHKDIMPDLLRNMIWELRPEIQPFFKDGFVTIR